MQLTVLTAEPGDVAAGSGTAVAVRALRAALQGAGVAAPVVRPRALWPSQTLARARFNRSLPSLRFPGSDALLGVNGDGWRRADQSPPLVVLVKALYAGAAMHERGVTRRILSLHARSEGEGARRAAAVVAPSRFAADSVCTAYGVPAQRVHVIPEPFDAAAWSAALPPVARTGNRVLCVAHLYPRKRVIDLLRAWPAVLTRVPGARLDIVGDGPELRRLVAAARGLPGCFLHGHVAPAGLPHLHARADVFCLPSAQETFSYAAVEALASGLPVVAADAGALPEVCAGAVAHLVAPGDVDALAPAIVDALSVSTRIAAGRVNPALTARYAPAQVAQRLIEVVRAL